MPDGIMQVSIIIPAYNVEKYVAECVVSACTQCVKDLEVIVVDDGSEDDTPRVLDGLKSYFGSRLIVRRIQNSGGPGAPRNLGLEIARGKYVLFLDADDVLPAGAVARLLSAAEREDADVVIGRRESFKGKRRWVPASHLKVLNALDATPATLYDCPDLFHLLAPNAKLIRRDLIAAHGVTFPVGLTYGEDHLFLIQCFYYSRRTTCLNEVVYNYRVGDASASNTLSAKAINSYAAALRDISAFFEDRGMRELKVAYDMRRLKWDVLRFSKAAVMERSDEMHEILIAVKRCLELTSQECLGRQDEKTLRKIKLLLRGYFRAYIALETIDNRREFVSRAKSWVEKKKQFVRAGRLSAEREEQLLQIFGRYLPVNPRKIVFAPAFHDHGNVMAVRTALLRSGITCKHVMVRHPERNWRRQVRRAFHLASAKVTVLESYYSPLYNMPVKEGQGIVQLWHAAGAFKRFGLSALGKQDSNEQEFEERAHRSYTHVIVSSPAVVEHYAEAFGCSVERVHALGFPRSDSLLCRSTRERLGDKAYIRYPMLRRRKVIGYYPTFRGNPYVRKYLVSDFDVRFLRDLSDDYVLAIKPHPEMRASAFSVPEDLRNRVVVVAPDLPVSALLAVTDILVTDYSSVIFEFAVLGRPMVFYAPDREAYEVERGFYWDYASFVPGPIVADSAELAKIIAENRFDLKAVEDFARRFHCRLDGQASSRVVEQVLEPLLRSPED